MTYEKLCEMAESMTIDQEIALYKEYSDKDCTACHGGGHSYDFTVTNNLDGSLLGGEQKYIEPCWCLDLLIQE